jgi:RimK family alpha-L-glutamate ligase
MKKILILVNQTPSNKNSFYAGLKERLEGTAQVDISYFEDVSIDIEQKNITVLIRGVNIKEYDLVYFRRAGKKFLWLAATMAVYLESCGIKYFDSTYKEVGPTGAKLTSLLKLAINGLPVAPTFFCYKRNIVSKSDEIIAKLGLPMVAKDFYSQRGLGVFLIKQKQDIADLIEKNPDKKFMFQKFIDKKEEFRTLVLEDKIGSFERKTSTDPNEFRNNVSLGAKEEFMDHNDTPAEVRDVSIVSAKVLKIEIAGVDIVIDKSDKVWILEVNRGPGLTYLSDESPEMNSIAEFFARKISDLK